MKLNFLSFKGTIPGMHPRLLPEDHGTVARNVRLDDGVLTPTREGRRVHTFGVDVASFIRRAGGAWLGFSSVVNAVNGAENVNRTYVTGDGEPKIFTSSTASVKLRLPPPSSRPTVDLVSGTVDPDLSIESVYAYTFVTELGEESSPSRVSRPISWSPGAVIRIGGLPATNPNVERRLTAMRIYRSVTDALGETQLYFLTQIGFQPEWDDDTGETETAEVIPSTDWTMPPADMQGIITMPNGMMAAFSGQELMFCEPYIHHAWPQKYRLKVDGQIVGLAAFGSSVVILTDGTPYMAQGTHPSSMIMERIEMDLPCVAARGIVDMGYAVIYPSTDGLVQVGSNGASVMSKQLFPREIWAGLQPETFIAGRQNGRYIFSYQPAPGQHDFDDLPRQLGIVDVSGAQPFFITDDAPFQHLYSEVKTGHLFGLFGDRGVVRWDDLAMDRKRMVWRSKENHLITPTNFGAIRVDCEDIENSDFICRVYANKKLVREITARNRADRLPSGFLSDVWQVEIEGTVPVTAIRLASSPYELAS